MNERIDLTLNVTARQAADTLIEMGISLAREEGLDSKHRRNFWRHVMESARELIGEELPKAKGQRSITDYQTDGSDEVERLTEDDPMPWGAFKDFRLGDIPDEYLDWLGRQPWIEEWPQLLAYIDVGR